MSTQPPPPRSLLSIRSFHDLFQYAITVLNDPRYFVPLAGIVLVGDALLTWLIISFVPCKSYVIYQRYETDKGCDN